MNLFLLAGDVGYLQLWHLTGSRDVLAAQKSIVGTYQLYIGSVCVFMKVFCRNRAEV